MHPMTLYSLIRSVNVSPAELARRLGVNKANVSRWNRGRVPLDHVDAISRATGIPALMLRPDLLSLVRGTLHPTGSRVSPTGRSLSPASDGAGELSPSCVGVQAHEASPVAAHGEGAYGVITSRPSGAK
jgi:transcriptional regulator with XRE-family HTH domain